MVLVFSSKVIFRWFSTQTQGSKGFFFSQFFSGKTNAFLLFSQSFFIGFFSHFSLELGFFLFERVLVFLMEVVLIFANGLCFFFFHVLCVFLFLGFFFLQGFFFSRGVFFSQGSVFSKHVFSKFFFQWGPFFFFSPRLGFMFFLNWFCFFF